MKEFYLVNNILHFGHGEDGGAANRFYNLADQGFRLDPVELRWRKTGIP